MDFDWTGMIAGSMCDPAIQNLLSGSSLRLRMKRQHRHWFGTLGQSWKPALIRQAEPAFLVEPQQQKLIPVATTENSG